MSNERRFCDHNGGGAVQAPFMHAPPAQDFPHAPQLSGSESNAASLTQAPPQRTFFPWHFIPHVSFTHVAVPPAGAGHGEHDAPHDAGSVLLTHLPAHAWNCTLHANAHAPPVQLDVALATTAHLRLQPPQWLTLVWGSTHSAPHWSGADGVHALLHWNEGPSGAQSAAAAPHVALQLPQVAAFDRSVSQPSADFALQFA